MKPLAAALAAAVLGSGCIFVDDDDCFGTVTIEWFDFLAADGRVVSCGGAGVDFVDIFIDGQPVARFFCADGGAIVTGVLPGDHVFTVEGVQASFIDDPGIIINRDQLTAAGTCGDVLVRAQPASGIANLDYTTTFEGCAIFGPEAPNCFLFFSVFDVVANTVTTAVTKSDTDPVKRLFPYPDDVRIELPAGPHVVQWMELVSAGIYAPLATRCTGTPFDVARGQEFLTSEIPLVPGGPACH